MKMRAALVQRVAEPVAFLSLATALHAAAWFGLPGGGGAPGGAAEAGSLTLSLAASPEISARLTEWDRAPDATPVLPDLHPVVVPTDSPVTPPDAAGLPMTRNSAPTLQQAALSPDPLAPLADTTPPERRRAEPRPAEPAPQKSTVPAAPTQPRSGVAASLGDGQQQRLMADWAGRIRARVERTRAYPRAARAAGITGTVTLRLELDGQGRLLAVSVARGSGHAVLDQAALQAVQRAGRLPKAPDGLTGARHVFALPLAFRM